MSTIRQIQPINTRGVIPGVIADTKPKFEWVAPGTLYVEETYQRNIAENSITMIRKIVGRWNWAHIKPPVCVRDSKGRLVVIDGQHTAIAAISHGTIPKIPVMIVEAATLKDRAAAFISQNRDRLALTPMHIYYAALAAGEEMAVAVNEACIKAGASILRASRGTRGIYRPGETFGIGTLTRLVKTYGVNKSARILKLLIDAKRCPVPAHEMVAVEILLFDPEFKDKIDAFDLVTTIRSKSIDEWKARAAKLVSTGVPRRRAVAIAWKRALGHA